MITINVAIVDDEPLARKGIKEFVDKLDYLNFKGFAKDVKGVVALLEEQEIDLLFIDIEMQGISGLEFVQTYEGKLPYVIFITAYADYAVDSYAVNAIDYILKPASFERFCTAVKKVKDAMENNSEQVQQKEYFFLKHEGAYEKINPLDILFISSMQNYIRIHFSSGKSMVFHSTLRSISENLDPAKFIVVHKSYIVNLDHVSSVSGNSIKMANGGEIPLGRQYKPDFLARILGPK
ncbi:MAG: response regulator transcription factor [Flavobacteriales bacterium]|nr:response regulator transcription factor [Flavobacteriales bacterium]